MNLRKFQLLMSKYGFSIIIMVLELALIFWFSFGLVAGHLLYGLSL